MLRKLRRWRALPAAERQVVLRAAWLLVYYDLAVRLRPLPKPRPAAGAASLEGERIAALVGITAAAHPWRARCLPRALTLQHLLAAHNIPSEVRLGARSTGAGSIEAHAWVEVDGQPLGDPPDVARRFPPFKPVA